MIVSEADFIRITNGLQTKSDKIRALARAGVPTADIARHLQIRYQHARNVLVASGLHQRADGAVTGVHAPAAANDPGGWTKVDAAGRLQVPADVLAAADIAVGDPVHVRATDDGIEILSRRASLKRAHAIARQFVPDGVSLVDELIAERRREARLEHE